MSVITRCQLICLLQSRSKTGSSWPPNLRLVCIHINSLSYTSMIRPVNGNGNAHWWICSRSLSHYPSGEDGFLSECCNFWSIDREDIPEDERDEYWPIQSQHVRSTQWDYRQRTVMRNEMLEQLDCEDTWFEEG